MNYEQMLTIEEVCERVGFGRGWVYLRIREGQFPAPVKFGPASRWSALRVDAWLRARAGTEVAVEVANGAHTA